MPTAWIAVNDRTAIPLLKALKDLGYKVPAEVSVVGFDNVNESHVVHPTLTTIHVYKNILGERGVEKLLWRCRNPEAPAEEKFVNTELVVRNSTAAPNR